MPGPPLSTYSLSHWDGVGTQVGTTVNEVITRAQHNLHLIGLADVVSAHLKGSELKVQQPRNSMGQVARASELKLVEHRGIGQVSQESQKSGLSPASAHGRC